jgi:hypothetical protein
MHAVRQIFADIEVIVRPALTLPSAGLLEVSLEFAHEPFPIVESGNGKGRRAGHGSRVLRLQFPRSWVANCQRHGRGDA